MIHRNRHNASAPFGPFFLLSALLVLSPTCLWAQAQPTPAEVPRLHDLRAVLDTGLVLQDRNGDGVVDDLELRILLGRNPGEAEVVAAANVATRFGYETSATELGLVGRAGTREVYRTPVVLIGAGAIDEAGYAGRFGEAVDALGPGQGVLLHLRSDQTFLSGGVAILGYDATGLLAAAGYLSGRYPGVWDPDGLSWKEVAQKLEEFVEGQGLEGATVSLAGIVVDGARPGVSRAQVLVSIPDATAFDRAVGAFSRPTPSRPG